MNNNEETTIQLDLSVETLAILGQQRTEGPLGEETLRPCGSGSMCTPPTCCP